MNDKNKNLVTRVVTVIVLLPVVVWLLWQGGLFSGALFGVASAAVAYEYFTIVQKRLTPIAALGVLVAGALPVFATRDQGPSGDLAFWPVALFFLIAWAYTLIRGPLVEGASRVSELLMGILYGAFGMTALAELRTFQNGFAWVFMALTLTWLNDTFAYFAGRAFGRHKLYPEVSPNKTWEGFAGGVVGSLVGMFACRAWVLPDLGIQDCVILGIAGGIFGPVGDLCESMLKRAYNVKDSGKMIPGHGGMLDRIDAVLFNAPLVYLYALFVRGAS